MISNVDELARGKEKLLSRQGTEASGNRIEVKLYMRLCTQLILVYNKVNSDKLLKRGSTALLQFQMRSPSSFRPNQKKRPFRLTPFSIDQKKRILLN